MAVLTRQIAETTPPELETYLLEFHNRRKHGVNAYYGQPDQS